MNYNRTWGEVEDRLPHISHMYPRGLRIWLGGECRAYRWGVSQLNSIAIANRWPSVQADELFVGEKNGTHPLHPEA